MSDFADVLKKYGGAVLLGFAALGVAAILGAVFWLLMNRVPTVNGALPLLAIGGIVVLVLMLTVVAIIFSIIKLTNPNQAMGLPEGSIRAVIALSLIVLFAILSVFLYQGISTGGSLNTIANLNDTERAQFMRDHATARDLQSVLIKDKDGQPLIVKDANGQPLKNADGTPVHYYDVSYRSPNPTGDDFAKQLLVLLGTLMTSITSFYLGAGTATSAAKVGEASAAGGAPTLSGIKPTSHTIAKDGPLIRLDITGANLNSMTNVKIERAGAQPILATMVASAPTRVTCELAVSAATAPAGDPWDVVVDNGGSKSVTLPKALTII